MLKGLQIRAIACLAALFFTGAALQAQGLPEFGGGDDPLEVFADEGIEWHRDEQLYLARGNAKAITGDLTVNAQLLRAYYREGETNSSEIYLLIAEGDVLIESKDEIVTGDVAHYSLDEAVFVIRGKDLKMVSKDGKDTITARDSLEYWEERNIAVARGAAEVIHEDNKINADILVAHFVESEKGAESSGDSNLTGNSNLDVDRVEGKGNVRIRTATDYVSGNEGIYYVKREFATLHGDVKITREENQMNGQYAEVDLVSGISKLLGSAPGTTDKGRVQGLILPKAKSKSEKSQ